MVQNLKWATAHLSRRLGAGALGAGRWGAQAWALGHWAGRWARGRVPGAQRAWAHGRALQAAGPAGARRSERAELAGARQAERAQAERVQAERAQAERGKAGRAAAGARGRAAGASRGGRLGGQCAPGCAQLGQVGVLCTPTQFLARFDSVLFLSH